MYLYVGVSQCTLHVVNRTNLICNICTFNVYHKLIMSVYYSLSYKNNISITLGLTVTVRAVLLNGEY